nr:uncharacterized protein LOC112988655 [Dromaius novaehollandiae]
MASLACTAASAGLPLAGLLGEASTHPGSELGMLPEPGTLLPHHPSAPVAGGERRDAGPAPPAPGPTLAMVAMGAILATVGMLGCYCSVRRHRHQVLQVFTGLVLLGLGSTLFFASSDYKLCIAYWYLLWGAVLYGVAGYYISSTAINPSRPLGFLWLMMIFTVFEMVISSITFSYSLTEAWTISWWSRFPHCQSLNCHRLWLGPVHPSCPLGSYHHMLKETSPWSLRVFDFSNTSRSRLECRQTLSAHLSCCRI